MEEIFRDVKGYENLYQISNLGNIKSLNYNHTGKEQILKPISDAKGYLMVGLSKDKNKKMFKIHQLVAQAFLPNPNNYPQVNHKTEVKTRNFVYINEDGTVDLEKSELEWCTNEYNNNYGTRNKRIAEALKGIKRSEETRKKIAEACKGRKLSEETKKKLSEINKGKKLSEETKKKLSKPVLQLDPLTNKIIKEWQSTIEVERQLGFNHTNISACCTGKLKTAYKFKWRYKT